MLALWIVVAAGTAIRISVAVYLGDTVTPLPGIFDQISYDTLALRVLDGQGFSFPVPWWPATGAGEPTAHWSYPYVLFLSGVYGVLGPHPLAARLIQALIVGILHPTLTFLVTRRIFGPRVAIVAAAAAGGYVYFIYYSAALVTESLYMVALLWMIDRALGLADPGEHNRRPLVRWILFGLAASTAVMLRQLVLLVVPVILAWICWRRIVTAHIGQSTSDRASSWAAGAAASLAVIAVVVLPWTVRNYRAFHEFVPLNTNAGFAFYWGNHPVHGTRFVPLLEGDTYKQLIPPELGGLNEAALDKELMRRGFRIVVDDPLRFLELSASRIREFVKFWPTRDSSRVSNYARVLSFGLFLPFMLVGLLNTFVGTARSPGTAASRDGAVLLVLVSGGLSLIHLVSWTLVRYRLPVDALMLPFAGYALVGLSALLPWFRRLGSAGPVPGVSGDQARAAETTS